MHTLGVACRLGEGPVWNAAEGTLSFVDIAGRRLHRWRIADGMHDSWEMPAEPGCAVPAGAGFALALRTGFHRFDPSAARLTPLGCPGYDQGRLRFNDGRCDAAGRFWAGTMHERPDGTEAGLWCLEPDGRLRKGPHGISLSNGLAFSPDGRWMYHADSRAGRVYRHAYDPATGTPGPREPWIEIPPDEGVPDGAAVDSEGGYWVAMYGGGQLLRFSPEGRRIGRIALPVRCPTMPAFGGPDLRTLFVTSAREGRDAAELAAHPLSGQVLVLEAPVAGRREPGFAA